MAKQPQTVGWKTRSGKATIIEIKCITSSMAASRPTSLLHTHTGRGRRKEGKIMSTQNFFAEKAYVVPARSESNEPETCRVSFDSRGNPVLILLSPAESLGVAAGTALWAKDIKGGFVQYFGQHRAALEAAGYKIVESIEGACGPRVEPSCLNNLPSLAD